MKQIIIFFILAIAVYGDQQNNQYLLIGVEYGMDVSVWQGTIDWKTVKSTGKTFAIARASYGVSTDREFENNWKGMIANGIKPGAYHYYVPSDEPAAQAKHFASVIKSVAGSYSSSYIPAALDIEVNGGQTAAELSANCIIFLQTLQQELGYQPMGNFFKFCLQFSSIVYTYIWFADTYLTNSALAGYPLWIANWDVSSPYIPGAWHKAGKSYLYWQYADNGAVSGISGKVDLDQSK